MSTRRITADQAREETRQHLKGPVIEPWMEYLYDVIRVYTRKGQFSITHVFSDRKSDVGRCCPPHPSAEMQTAIRKQLEADGFEWKEHEDPDPGHPASGPYNEIKWS